MRKPRKIIIRQNVSRAIVLHPSPDSIRNFYIRAYKTQLASLKNASEKMRRFVEIDQPAFTLWWQQEFSELLNAQMSLEQTFYDLQLLTDAVEQYKTHYKCTYQRAYSVVSKAQGEGHLGELMQEIFDDLDRAQQRSSRVDASAFAEEFFQDPSDDFKVHHTDGAETLSPAETVAAQSPEETTESYIKRIYRDLVRLLHPDAKDRGEQQSAKEKALWHELQNAYQWRDLDRIEAIFSVVNGPNSTAIDFATIPISDILAMKDTVARKLGHLRRDIKIARKEANWDFENRRKNHSFLSCLGQSIESELTNQTMLLENRIEKLQKRVKSWTSIRKNQKQKSSRRETTSDTWTY